VKIVISSGCTAFYALIDGKPVNEVDMDKVLDHILPQIRVGIKNGTMQFDSLLRFFEPISSETSEACEQCGDCVTKDFYEIP